MALGRPKEKFCHRGHDKDVVGRRSNGYCIACARTIDISRNKKLSRKINHAERQWAYQAIKKFDSSSFTIVDFDRLYQVQQGKCAICNKHQIDLETKLSVDHDHKTGIVRGLVCNNCNKNLGVLENKEFVVSAMTYLNIYKNGGKV